MPLFSNSVGDRMEKPRWVKKFTTCPPTPCRFGT
jgi:hypothetical protein